MEQWPSVINSDKTDDSCQPVVCGECRAIFHRSSIEKVAFICFAFLWSVGQYLAHLDRRHT